MDFTQAALLVVAVFTIVELVKRAVPAATKIGWVTIVIALAVGVGLAFLVGASDFGGTQIINGEALDKLNAASKTLVGILVGAGAVGFDNVLTAVKNVGENQPVE